MIEAHLEVPNSRRGIQLNASIPGIGLTTRSSAGTVIWHHAQIRKGTKKIGANCIVSKSVYVDAGVLIGNRFKIQNYVSIYHGVTIEDGVFCGPHCVFTNESPARRQPGWLVQGSGRLERT